METLNKINREILSVTATIQNEFPELYKNLSETPMFISNEYNDSWTDQCNEYLESIQIQLNVFELPKSPHP